MLVEPFVKTYYKATMPVELLNFVKTQHYKVTMWVELFVKTYNKATVQVEPFLKTYYKATMLVA